MYVYDKPFFLFKIDFKSLYTNISVKVTIKLKKMLFFNNQNVIPNAHCNMELMELELNSAVMKFQEGFFLQIFGIPRTSISDYIHCFSSRRVIYDMEKFKHNNA